MKLIPNSQLITNDQSNKSRIFQFLLGLGWGILLVGLAVFAVMFWQVYRPVPVSSPAVIKIVQGEASEKIAARLWERGLVRNPVIWLWYAGVTGRARLLQAGTYEFSPGITPAQVSRILARGEVIRTTRKITILPGENLESIDAKIAESLEKVTPGELLVLNQELAQASAVLNFPWLTPALEDFFSNYKVSSLEGILAAQTYFLDEDSNLEDFLVKAFDYFEKDFLPVLEESGSGESQLDPYENLILASILEKEVSSFKDRQIVAGILLKRLKKGLRLQVDATVNYITGKNHAAVRLEDSKIESPYNTYQNKGLPPTPIASPSLEAVQAVLAPQQSPYLFYLSAPSGKTIYSRDFKEHVQAKQRYLK
jgi:UPF0755 protein